MIPRISNAISANWGQLSDRGLLGTAAAAAKSGRVLLALARVAGVGVFSVSGVGGLLEAKVKLVEGGVAARVSELVSAGAGRPESDSTVTSSTSFAVGWLEF